MGYKLDILVICRSGYDMETIRGELNASGLDIWTKQVEDLEQTEIALRDRKWDLLISCCENNDIFNASFLDLTERLAPKLPCIWVVDRSLEAEAQKCIRKGNWDYITYHNMERLGYTARRLTAGQPHKSWGTPDKSVPHKIFDNFPGMIWHMDEGGAGTYFNRQWLQFTGRTLKEEQGDGWKQGIHAADIETIEADLQNAFSRRLPFKGTFHLKHRDGSYRCLLSTAAPLKNPDGRFGGYIGAAYDITEQKQSEDNLRKYKILYENAKDIIFFIDLDGNILEANQAAVKTYGYTREELLAMNIFRLRKTIYPTVEQMQQAAAADLFFETIHYRKDGSTLNVEVSSQGTYIDGKKILVSIVRNTTERKKVEEEMRRVIETAEAASRAKSEFLANMSHEIRTPLNGIIGMIDLTLGTELEAKQRENLLVAKNCTDSLMTVINDILDFSKIEAGKMVLEKIHFDNNDMISQIIKAHYVKTSEKGLQISCKMGPDIPRFLIGDPNRLKQILDNIIGNAIKFTDMGEILVQVEKYGETGNRLILQYSVADTGIGISKDEMPSLFRSFSQVDGSITRKFGGTGLGLAISKRLCEMMGGAIWVESEKYKGSTFSFIIPFDIKGSSKTLQKSAESYKIIKSAQSLDILLVEDDEINQVVTERLLRERGHRVHITGNGKEALEAWEKKHYDIILMDIQMPEMDGIEATACIREKEKKTGTYTPIIALTAFAFEGDRQRFLSAGMDDYISKPIQISALFETIERYSPELSTPEIPYPLGEDGEAKVSEFDTQGGRFAEMAPQLVEKVKKALDAGNINTAEKIVHLLKNLSNDANISSVKRLAFKIELALRRKDLEEACQLYQEMCKEIESVLITIATQERSEV